MFISKVVVVEDILGVYPMFNNVVGGVPCTLVLLMCGMGSPFVFSCSSFVIGNFIDWGSGDCGCYG